MTIHNPALLAKVRSDGLMSSINGMPCALRIASFAGMPCAHQSTVVGCHLPGIGKSMGSKVSDIHVAAGCHTCHDMLDGRNPRGNFIRENYPAAYGERLLLALAETQARWIEMGAIIVPDGRIV